MILTLFACIISDENIQQKVNFDGDSADAIAFGGDDCDDGNPAIHPGAEELCDGIDSNCDGIEDDLADRDGDGVSVCEGDCDDDDPDRAAGLPEDCDAIDNDCDGRLDNGLNVRNYWRDHDTDGFGAGDAVEACTAPTGFVDNDDDCDDSNADLTPDTLWYEDVDGDGTGGDNSLAQCETPAGVWVRSTGDCNDDSDLFVTADRSVSFGENLPAVVAAACADSVLTIGAGEFTGDLAPTVPLTLNGAGSTTEIVGAISSTTDLTLTDLAIEGRVSSTGGTHTMTRVDVEGPGTELENTTLIWTDVEVLNQPNTNLDIVAAGAGSLLKRVQVQSEPSGAGFAMTVSDGSEEIRLEHVMLSRVPNGMLLDNHPASLQFVTVADSLGKALEVRGPAHVDILDTLIGITTEATPPPPTAGQGLVLNGTDVDLGYVYILGGSTVIGTNTGPFEACEGRTIPQVMRQECEMFDADLLDANSGYMFFDGASPDTPNGLISDFDLCSPILPPSPGVPPDDCHQPGFYGGQGSVLLP